MITHKNISEVSYLKASKSSSIYYADKKDLFWPFYLWRVLAPKSKPPLNVFQMFLLKLIRAGCVTVDTLHEYSNLDPELINHIHDQLNQQGYINNWDITDHGRSLLRGEMVNSEERASYYLIQDALTGKLLPRVLSYLPYIDSMDFSEKYPGFIVSRSSGKKNRPLLLNKGIKKPSQPTAEEMSDCIREHRRALNQLKQADLYIPENALNIEYSVQLIEEEAIPVYVHLDLFSTYSGERMWYLSDPTGLTPTVAELNDVAEQVIEYQKELASRVDSVMGLAAKEQTTSYHQRMREFEEQAKLELLATYPWTQRDTLIEKHVLAMLRLKKQVNAESSSKPELLESLLNEQQKVVEAWLKAFMQPSKANRDWEALVYRWNGEKPIFQQNKGLIQAVYLRVKGVSSYVANRLATVKGGSVQRALTHGDQSLKPMLAGVLLRFPDVVEEINEHRADWLDLAVELADTRNKKSAHAGGLSLTRDETLEHLANVENLLTVLEKLLGIK